MYFMFDRLDLPENIVIEAKKVGIENIQLNSTCPPNIKGSADAHKTTGTAVYAVLNVVQNKDTGEYYVVPFINTVNTPLSPKDKYDSQHILYEYWTRAKREESSIIKSVSFKNTFKMLVSGHRLVCKIPITFVYVHRLSYKEMFLPLVKEIYKQVNSTLDDKALTDLITYVTAIATEHGQEINNIIESTNFKKDLEREIKKYMLKKIKDIAELGAIPVNYRYEYNYKSFWDRDYQC